MHGYKNKANSVAIDQVTGMLIILMAIGSAQTERWFFQYDGGVNASDEAKVIIENTDGNIYAAGYGHIAGNGKDVVVVGLTPAGDERWLYTYNGPGDSTDVAMDIACDSSGNLYIAAGSYNNNSDAVIISLTPEGTERWVYRYNGTGNGVDIVNAIATGLDGHIYSAGVSVGSGTGDDGIIISVDSSGTERWVYRYNWTGGSDGINDLIYGFDENIYAAGFSYHSVQAIVFTVFSVDSAGNERWVYHTQGTGVVNEAAYSIDYGVDHNIYSAGMSYLLDFSVITLDTTGNLEWDFIYGPPGESDKSNKIIYSSNKIYAGGYLSTSGNGYDLAIVNLLETGDTSWIYRYNGTGNSNDIANDIVFGVDNCIYTCGFCTDASGQENLLVVRLDTNGIEQWQYRFDGNAGALDKANSIIYGSDDNIYLGGCITDSLTNLDFAVISLDTIETGVRETPLNCRQAEKFWKKTIFFQDKIVIEKPEMNDSKLKVVLYNVQGQKLQNYLVRHELQRILIYGENIMTLPSGVYFLHLLADDLKINQVVKLIKL